MRKIVTVAPGRMEIQEAPDPVAGADEAVVRIEAVGLCGSDYHLFLGDHPYARFPQTQGHELAGVVETLGAGYQGGVEIGQRVAIEPVVPCGGCFACRRGRYNCCASLNVMGAHIPGGLAEKITVRASALYPAGDLDPDVVALCEPVSIGLQAVVRARVEIGDTVVVLGAGPIGQAVVLAASDRGADILVADRISNRLRIAERLGASLTVHTSQDHLAANVEKWTAGAGASIVIDATGVPELIRLAFDLVAPSGTIVIVGISDREVSLPVIEFTRKELNVVGSRNNTGLFDDAIDLVRRHEDRVRSLITHVYPLEKTGEAIRFALDHPDEVEKVIVRVDDAR
jgi:L-gulonate 5-dehydrogenase